MLVLSVLQGDPAHGYAVIQRLAARSDGAFDLPEGTAYPALYRLERGGLLVSSETVVDSRRRRVYRLTPAGEDALTERVSEWKSFARSVGRTLQAGVLSDDPMRATSPASIAVCAAAQTASEWWTRRKITCVSRGGKPARGGPDPPGGRPPGGQEAGFGRDPRARRRGPDRDGRRLAVGGAAMVALLGTAAAVSGPGQDGPTPGSRCISCLAASGSA